MRRVACLFLLAIIFLTGCTPPQQGFVAESEQIAFRRGKQRLKEGRPEEALNAFLSVIESRPQAPESHLEVGLLYLNRFAEPVMAIYHFEAYLRQNPKSQQADRVKQLIVTAKKEFARSLPAAPFGDEVEKLDLKEELDQTSLENKNLKTEIAKLREQLERYKTILEARHMLSQPKVSAVPTRKTPSVERQQPTDNQPAKVAQKYTVVEGDTLSSISKKFYSTANRWNDIYEANKNTMRSPAALKIGQELLIP